MSRHTYTTMHAGRRTAVVMGYDRPLRYVFMTVEDLDASDDEAAYLYSNLDQPDPDSLTLGDFRSALQQLGIAVPESMFTETEADRQGNVGNRSMVHR